MRVMFEIICTTQGRTREEIEALREGLGQLIHVTFAGAYTFSYTIDEIEFEEAALDIRESSNWWAEIRRALDSRGAPIPFRGTTDWGLMIDLLRSLNVLTTMELRCSALPSIGVLSSYEALDEPEFPHEDHTSAVGGSSAAASLFSNMLDREKYDQRRLSVRVFVGSEESLPAAVIRAIGIELSGSNNFEVVEMTSASGSKSEDEMQQLFSMSPAEALLIFHPPFGEMYRTTGEGRFDLSLMTDETEFPPTGIMLGKARIRQIRTDEEIEVRLSEADRLRHTYIVGKTGSGKTNLLKLMASQDVKISGRGVTIIDPHGDLVDHVLREIPQERVHEVVLIDLARTDALPILNPLDLDRQDITLRDRTVQELISLMHLRVFHQYTGPRFDELVRVVFNTMLDEGYPEPASFVEVSRLLMDEDLNSKIRKLLKDKELKERWDFQRTLQKDPEWGAVVHYVTSKFDDIARDSTLRCVMGGSKSTINIERIVQQGGILLVRIPEAVIGKQAADFIGSLILLQLRMAIIRRREVGELQHYHFVYVDEFQNFANTDFHTIVAEARKFNIGFTLANQNLEQLREFRTYTGVHEHRLISAIFGNVANLIVFKVGALDAQFLSNHLNVPAEDIIRIGRFQALAKISVNGFDTTPFTLRMDEAIRLESPRNLEAIEKRMREHYWVESAKVLEEIAGRLDRVREKVDRSTTDSPDWFRPKIFTGKEPPTPDELAEEPTADVAAEATTTEDGAEQEILERQEQQVVSEPLEGESNVKQGENSVVDDDTDNKFICEEDA